MNRLQIVLTALDRTAPGLQSARGRLDGLAAVATRVGVALGGIFSLAQVTSFVSRTADAGAAVDRLAKLSGVAGEQFQELAFGARTVGIQQEKLADILKDVQDKVGDFLQTGGGPLADFFENIAPKVGVTAEQFRKLGGAEALQLYVSSLQKANLSQNEMVFFMEAIASDSALLLPLLRDNGREFGRLAEKAREAGAVMSDDMIRASRDLDRNLDELSTRVLGLARDLSGPLISALNSAFAALDRARGNKGGFLDGLATEINLSALRGAVDSTEGQMQRMSAAVEKARAVLAEPFDGSLGAAFARASATRTIEGFETLKKSAAEARAEIDKIMGYGEGQRRPANEGGGRFVPRALPAPAPKPTPKQKDALVRIVAYEMPESTRAALQALERTDAAKIRELNATLDELFSMRAGGLGGSSDIDEAIERVRDELEQLSPAARQAAEDQERLNSLLAATPQGRLAAVTQDVEFLNRQFEGGKIQSVEQWADAVRNATTQLGTGASEQLERVSTFADQAGRNIQDALGDTLLQTLDGKFSGIGRLWGDMLKRMIAQAAAAQLAKSLFGDSLSGGKGGNSGLLGGAINWLGTAFGGARAMGGPVSANRAYLVGERGPEIVVPRAAGTVLPNGVGMGGSPSFVVNVQGDASENTIRLIRGAMAQFEARMMMRAG